MSSHFSIKVVELWCQESVFLNKSTSNLLLICKRWACRIGRYFYSGDALPHHLLSRRVFWKREAQARNCSWN